MSTASPWRLSHCRPQGSAQLELLLSLHTWRGLPLDFNMLSLLILNYCCIKGIGVVCLYTQWSVCVCVCSRCKGRFSSGSGSMSMTQQCVVFVRPLERTVFLARCRGTPPLPLSPPAWLFSRAQDTTTAIMFRALQASSKLQYQKHNMSMVKSQTPFFVLCFGFPPQS